jgi:hypothetical protein
MPSRQQPSHLIAADAYPQMMNRQDAARAMLTLRSPQTMERAQAVMETCKGPMRKAILDYVQALEAAGGDAARIYAQVHDIRGFAETVGMVTTGRIAEILCRYMDDMERVGRPVDDIILSLHISAIARAARAEEGDEPVGEMVASELAALVARRLSEAL